MTKLILLFSSALLAAFPAVLFAAESAEHSIDLTHSSVGIASVLIFMVSYILVMTEEFTHMRKS